MIKFRLIEPRFDFFYKNWIQLYDKIQKTIDLRIASLNKNLLFSSDRFLDSIKGIEVYFNYKNKKEKRKVLKLKLEYCFLLLPDDIQFNITNDIDKYLSSLITSRNYFTHYNPDIKDKILTGQDLINAILNLENLITYLLFREIGYNDSEIRENSNLFEKFRFLKF